MRNPKALAIALGALLLIAFGFFFVRGPKPIIEIKGEELTKIGFFPVINTWLTGVLVVIVVSLLFYFGARKLKLIPSGFQNAIEAVAEALYNLCIQTAGEKNGRRFFPVAATIFVFIWIANWMALTPIFNSIGTINEVDSHHFSEEAHVVQETAGVYFIWPFSLFGGEDPFVEFEVDETEIDRVNEELTEAKADGASEGVIAELEHELEEVTVRAQENAIAIGTVDKSGIDVDTSSCDTLEGEEKTHCEEEIKLEPETVAAAQEAFDGDNKKFAHLFPFFRSMNTDLNSPLSLAIISVIFIEFWGITTLGLFKYGGKFIRNPFTNPIGFFVGLLEMVAEFARLISFTFRLFGNMLAGEILLLVMTFLIPFLIALPFYGLEVFVGVVQAFVFFMLTIAFGALAAESHDEHEEHAPGVDHGEHGEATALEPAH